jgi:hypothetical protein
MGILIAKSMQNPKKYADGLPTAISLYIQLIISCAILGICGNFQFDGYKISHRLTKMSQSRFCSSASPAAEGCLGLVRPFSTFDFGSMND